MDAATKSTKEDMLRITEEIQYSSFSGKRKLYLFDESHRLSKQALDAILKPMEDSLPGSEDKQLVCIFCTTEPEKMQPTIFSRCAPAFVIKPVSPEGIAERLLWICEQENIPAELDALVAISEVTECHIRDALKILEGVSFSGRVDLSSVTGYLRLGANDLVLDIIESIGTDLQGAILKAFQLAETVSATVAYERLTEASLCAYRAGLKVGKTPVYWNRDRIESLSGIGSKLVEIAGRFASPPRKPSPHTLILDISALHHAFVGGFALPSSTVVVQQISAPVEPAKVISSEGSSHGTVKSEEPKKATPAPPVVGGGVVAVNPRAVGHGSFSRQAPSNSSGASANPETLSPDVFRSLVRFHLRELLSEGAGSQG